MLNSIKSFSSSPPPVKHSFTTEDLFKLLSVALDHSKPALTEEFWLNSLKTYGADFFGHRDCAALLSKWKKILKDVFFHNDAYEKSMKMICWNIKTV